MKNQVLLTMIVCLIIQLLILQSSVMAINASNTFPGGCTVFSAAKDEIVLAATNKDWDNIKTIILFLPSSEDKYGRVY